MANLTGQNIKDTYQELVTLGDGNTITNGTGSQITDLAVTASEATHALTASYAPVEPAFSASISSEINAIEGSVNALNQATGSYLITGSVNANVITLEKVDGTSFNLTVATGSATSSSYADYAVSSSHATYAETAGSSTTSVSASYASNASSADSVAFANITGKPTLVSGSAQIDLSQATGVAANAVSASHAVNADSALTANTATTAGSATSASYASNADQLDGLDSTAFAQLAQNNNFTGTQTFDNIAVNGTGSFAYIQSVTGSAKIIGDAFIILNNNTPAERYAGMVVQDSGSTVTTASFYFDGLYNDWNYEYTNDGGATIDMGVAMFGPEYNTKGSPIYPTANRIVKGNGGHHLEDSNISDDGSTVSISTPVNVTGQVSASSYIGDGSGLTGVSAGLVAGTGTYSMQSSATLTSGPAVASGRISIALGDGATASDTGSIAIGFGATGSGYLSTAIGVSAEATNDYNTAVGWQVTAQGGQFAAAFGNNGTTASGSGTTALGSAAIANETSATAVGASANANGNGAVAVGSTANAPSYESTAIGSRANAEAFGSVAVGGGANGSGTLAIAIGNSVSAKNFGSIAIGVNVETETNDKGIVIGYGGNVYAANAIALGVDTWISSSNAGAIAIGHEATTSGENEILIGSASISHGANTVTIGNPQITATYLYGTLEATASYAIQALSASYAPAGPAPTLQQVTTAGQTSTNYIEVNNGGGNDKHWMMYNQDLFFSSAGAPIGQVAANESSNQFEVGGFSGYPLALDHNLTGLTIQGQLVSLNTGGAAGKAIVYNGTNSTAEWGTPASASYATTAGTAASATTATSASYASYAATVQNENTNSGSLSFWQGSQAEYDLISGSASNSTIYFII